MSVAAVHEGIKAAYEDVAYVGRPNHHSHPDRLAAIARLFGLAAPDPARARVLEVGCGDGANLVPMAVRYPDARFVGCDASTLLMGRARAAVDALGLSNLELAEGDLKVVGPSLGTFDYVIAHGFYSWVPPDVRDAFIALLGRQLAPDGLAFISYNVLPGCHVRRIGWDLLRFSVPGNASPAERIAAVRREFRDITDAWSAMPGIPGHLGREYAQAAERSDSAVYHDDLSVINEPIHFTGFAQHVGRHGLGFLAEAEPGTMSMAGLPERMSELASRADALSREQALDFARMRRFRQSIVAPGAAVARARLSPDNVEGIHLSAVAAVLQERATGAPRSVEGRLVEFLVDAYPASVPTADIVASYTAGGMTVDEARTTVLRACFSGAADVHAQPLPLVTQASERPRASILARWQARSEDVVTNLRHASVHIDDATSRALIVACDGTNDRAALARAASLASEDALAVVDDHLERYALAGIFEA